MSQTKSMLNCAFCVFYCLINILEHCVACSGFFVLLVPLIYVRIFVKLNKVKLLQTSFSLDPLSECLWLSNVSMKIACDSQLSLLSSFVSTILIIFFICLLKSACILVTSSLSSLTSSISFWLSCISLSTSNLPSF